MAGGLCGLTRSQWRHCGRWCQWRACWEKNTHSTPLGLGALHTWRLGTQSCEVFKGEGRWASVVYKGCVHSHGQDAHWTSGAMVESELRVARSSPGKKPYGVKDGLCCVWKTPERKSVLRGVGRRRRGGEEGTACRCVRQVTGSDS